MRDLVILGSSPKPGSSPFFRFNVDRTAFDHDADIWAFNSFARLLPRVDGVFQMHLPERYRNQPSWEWLKQLTTADVFMREQDPEVPRSVKYPFDEIFKMTEHVRQGANYLREIKFLTSSGPMAIALAIYQNRPKIHFYGFMLEEQTEYFEQRECIMFWMGLAAGRGISLDIHCLDNIFRKDIYMKPSEARLLAERLKCNSSSPPSTGITVQEIPEKKRQGNTVCQ